MKEMKKPLRLNFSKRITGASMITAAGIMAAILFAFSLKAKVGDPDTALGLIKWFIIGGAGLFGVSIFDKK